jgi:acetylornithine deacetylase
MRPSERTIELLRTLVSFDTTSRHSNLPAIEFVRDQLSALGVASEIVWHEQDRKANLYASIGSGRAANDDPWSVSGGIALSAHTDVVPVEGQDWATDPWTMTEVDGRLYGRGTADMKGFLAVVLAALPRFVEAELTTPLHLVCSPDEEVGCVGVLPLLAELERRDARPAMAIVGEPTSMQVVRAHKGHYAFRGRVTGVTSHSSAAPRAVNAVEYAARIVTRIAEIARRKADGGPFDERYPVAHTTLHTGVLEGGTAFNIVPRHARFDFEIRTVAGDSHEELFGEIESFARSELLPEMRSVYPEAAIEFEVLSATRGLDTLEGVAVIEEAQALVRDLGPGGLGQVSYATEAGLFQAAGIPAVVCGPGSIEQAHGPNEYIELDQLARAERFMDRLLERVTR